MGNYENYRTSVAQKLITKIPDDMLQNILKVIDDVSSGYDIVRRSTDLILSGGLPETVKLYLAARGVEHVAKTTLKDYKRILEHFFKVVNKSVMDVTTNDIRVYLFRYEEERNVQKDTLDHIRTVITSFFEWMTQEEYIQKNPARIIKPIRYNLKKQPTMDDMELAKMRQACSPDNLIERALVDFLFSTGARISEVSNALISDLNFNNHTFLIRHGKGDKERITYLNAEAELSVLAYMKSRNDSNPYLFVTGRRPHNQMSTKSLEVIIKDIRIRAGITKKITPHAFRRTTATLGTKHGMPVQEMQKLLGHSRLDTTMRYVTVDQESVQISHRKYI